MNTTKSENQKGLPDNANSNQNENNSILQNQPCVQSQTKEQNSIDSTQDLRSDITKADSVKIESENYHQTACTSKDQGRRTQADKSVKVRSNIKLLYYSSQLNNQTSNNQNIDRKPQQICSKDINRKSRANRSKNQHEWINRLPLIGSSNIHPPPPPKKQSPPTKKFKQRWRTAKCDVQDSGLNFTSRSRDCENPFYNHPYKKKPPLSRKGKYQRQQKKHRSGRYCTPVCNTQTGTNLFNPMYERKPSQLKSELQLEDIDSWEVYLQ